MRANIHASAKIVTDEFCAYGPAVRDFIGGHETVNHSEKEYVNANGFNTNTAESYFALLKRAIRGSFHHISKQHLHRYCNEFSFAGTGAR